MVEVILLFLFQHLRPRLQITIHHFDYHLVHFRAVEWKGGNYVFGHQVSPSVRWVAFVHFDKLGNICSSEYWNARDFWELHLVLFLRDGKGQGHNELTLIIQVVRWGSVRRFSTGIASGMATKTGDCGYQWIVLSWHFDWYCCSGVEMGWWFRWWIGSNWYSEINY